MATLTATTQLYAQKKGMDSLQLARQQRLDSTRTAQKRYFDSVKTERQRVMDSTRTAQQQYFDSMKVVRQAKMDSVKTDRQRVSDSLAKIREYKESKRYKDSVASARQRKLDSVQVVRQHRLDSIKVERKRVTDSVVAVRKVYTDSLKTVQKHRSDSLASIREYRESKRYKDSVAVVRKLRLDSTKASRTAYYDSIAAGRKKVTDSLAAARKTKTDSMMASRQKYSDSVKAVRQVRSDSLAKLKEKREKDQKIKAKQKEEKMQLALELKIKKKQEAWNNEKMMKKRWGFPRSVAQNVFTRYNYYFNADRKMDEALENMQRFRQENYDSLLALYPFDPDRDSAVLAPDMDSIIQKASLGIQIHDPRTKWADDLYLLLGQAYYYKGDYRNAGDAFKYVVSLRNKRKKKKTPPVKNNTSIAQKEKTGIGGFLEHRSVHNEAILWLARTYTESHQEGNAESVLDLLETDPNFPGSLEGRLALEKSYIRLSENDHHGAIEHLTVVANDKKMPNWIRRRAAFINGQLQQHYEEYQASAESFAKVTDLNPDMDMDFYARKNRATSMMMLGGPQEESVAQLKKILNDAKYSKYYEQVYYLLGRLSINGNKPDEAVDYLKEGLASSKSTAAQKAMSYAALGDVYYSQRKYEDAKTSYDSASAFANAAPNDPLVKNAISRSVVLGNLTKPLRTIRDNDSLLALSAMSEKDQLAVVRRYIRAIEKRKADSLFLAENEGLLAATKNSGTNANSKNAFANWYYSNPAQLQKGYNDFKQKWGNRPLADNWRRSSAGGFASHGGGSNPGAEEENAVTGVPTEESLLAAIPKTENEKNQLKLDIRKAYMAAANAYVKDLEDYPPATTVLDTFDTRFPQHEFKPEEAYLRYIIALKQNKPEEAKKYSTMLLSEYAGSEWAKMVKPTEDGAGLNNNLATKDVYEHYDKTYALMQQGAFEQSLPMAKEGQLRFSQQAYKDKFMIIEAASHAMLGSYKPADSLMTLFMSTHTNPNDSLRSWAEAILKYMGDNRERLNALPVLDSVQTKPATSSQPLKPGQNADVIDSDTTAQPVPPSDQPPASGADGTNVGKAPAEYAYNPQEEHYVIFVFPALDQRAKGVEAALQDFNKFKFGSMNLSTAVNMLQGNQGAIAVSSFKNKNQAVIYLNSLKKTEQVFREYNAGEYKLLMISSSNYQKLLQDKNLPAYLKFYNGKY